MTANESDAPLDLLLHWRDASTRRDSGRDSVAVSPEEGEQVQGEVEARGPELEADPAALTRSEEPTEAADGLELFEWSADREQALIDALEGTPEGAVPRVHQQLEDIAKALEAGELQPELAAKLLAEVETYLTARVSAEKRKVTVAHEAFLQSRSDKLNALFAWQESATALREYLENGDALQLKVAFYAAEQGKGFLAASRDVLMAAEPEWEEEDDQDEVDDVDDDDLSEEK